MKDDPRERYESMRQVGLLSTIPMLLLVSPLIGYGLGKLLDRWFHTHFLVWVFLGIGAVAGIREVIRVIRRAGSGPGTDS